MVEMSIVVVFDGGGIFEGVSYVRNMKTDFPQMLILICMYGTVVQIVWSVHSSSLSFS